MSAPLKAIPEADEPTREKTQAGAAVATVIGAPTLPLAGILSGFTLASRDIASFESTGLAFDTKAPAEAGIACARQEDSLLLYGSSALGTDGLLSVKGSVSHKLRPWKQIGAAADDFIAAVTRLDDAGFHGPYALALAPALYNLLLRRYEQGQMTELEHARTIATAGIAKSAALKSGGVLIATGRQYLSIALGQDLMVGFVGPTPGGYEFTASESIALRVLESAAICVLKGE